jgi:hypothetical protein
MALGSSATAGVALGDRAATVVGEMLGVPSVVEHAAGRAPSKNSAKAKHLIAVQLSMERQATGWLLGPPVDQDDA